MLEKILLFIITIMITAMGYFLKDMPILFRELKIEKIKNDNSTNLQVESYFREISSKDLQETFKSWLTLIDDINDGKLVGKELERYIKNLQVKTFMYGSSTTIKINASMMQFFYQQNKPENKININFGKEKETDYRSIVYTAYMVASLKKDFTGYSVSPREFLEFKITDLKDKNEESFKNAEKKVFDELSKKGISI
ncbi:hypothetical protein [Jeotgalibaca dankookensis]|uniref:hypothetical protein n=1 Tax=Jeotgalibaca dankookensis TaxID=708126 RepID=UPI000785B3D0|nr:hypothetical protein [Jeotgalibaca dankookensis]